MLASEGCGGHRRDLASPLAGAVTATTPTPPSTVNRTLARERRRSVAAVLVYIMPHSIGRPAVRTAGAVPMVDQNSDSFDSPNRPPFRRLNPHCVLWSPVPQVQNESPPPSAGTMAASPSTGAHGAVAAASRQTVTTLESTRDGLAVCATAACRLRSPLLMPANRTQPPVWAHLPFSLCVSAQHQTKTSPSSPLSAPPLPSTPELAPPTPLPFAAGARTNAIYQGARCDRAGYHQRRRATGPPISLKVGAPTNDDRSVP